MSSSMRMLRRESLRAASSTSSSAVGRLHTHNIYGQTCCDRDFVS